MGFYGNITNAASTNFTFDITYPNRVEMDKNAKDDGVSVGRYVRVEYAEDFKTQGLISVAKDGDGTWYWISNEIVNGENKREKLILIENEDRLPTDNYVKIDQIVLMAPSNINYGVIKQEDNKIIVKDIKTLYEENYETDFKEYGASYDGTAWVKQFKNDKMVYTLVAELNTVVPTFEITPVAPSDNPKRPHFGPESTNLNYDLHIQPPWGFKIADVKNVEGMSSSDIEGLWNSKICKFAEVIYDNNDSYITFNLYKDDLDSITDDTKSNWTISPYSEPQTIYTIEKIRDTNLDSPQLAVQIKLQNEITPEEEYSTKFKNGNDFIIINQKYIGGFYYNAAGFNPDKKSRVKDPTNIVTLINERSGKEYLNPATGQVESGLPDTKGLVINLPSLGNAVSDTYDLLYGVNRNNDPESLAGKLSDLDYQYADDGTLLLTNHYTRTDGQKGTKIVPIPLKDKEKQYYKNSTSDENTFHFNHSIEYESVSISETEYNNNPGKYYIQDVDSKGKPIYKLTTKEDLYDGDKSYYLPKGKLDIKFDLHLKNGGGDNSLVQYSDDEQRKNSAGKGAAAFGSGTTASGNYSHAEGYGVEAWGEASHIEGRSKRTYNSAMNEANITIDPSDSRYGTNEHILEVFKANKFSLAKGDCSHVEGQYNLGLGTRSHAEGSNTIAIGLQSHAEGYMTIAKGENSHAEGNANEAWGADSHIEGYSGKTYDTAMIEAGKVVEKTDSSYGTDEHIMEVFEASRFSLAKGNCSHVEGQQNLALAKYTHAEGVNNIAKGESSHVEGSYTKAIGNNSHTEGSETYSVGKNSHAEGLKTTAKGDQSHAEGYSTQANGLCAHAEGYNTHSTGFAAHTEGYETTASGQEAHAEGYANTASGSFSHAEGYNTTSSGAQSHAEGAFTQATEFNAHAEGYGTQATGNASHSEGYKTIASGTNAHTEGNSTIASSDNQHVQGKYNVEDTENKYAHIVGWGENNSTRKNIHTIDTQGNAEFAGNISFGDNIPYLNGRNLSNIISGLEYEDIKLNNFTVNDQTIHNYEIGTTVQLEKVEAKFSETNGSYHTTTLTIKKDGENLVKPIGVEDENNVTQDLTEVLEEDKRKVRKTNHGEYITITATIEDELAEKGAPVGSLSDKNSFASQDVKINFYYKAFVFVGDENSKISFDSFSHDSVHIKDEEKNNEYEIKQSKLLTNTKENSKGTYTWNTVTKPASGKQYVYVLSPKVATFSVGGFSGGFELVKENIVFNLPEGNETYTGYKLYRTIQPQSGDIKELKTVI